MNKSFLNSYSGKKILVTGITGFKGSWLGLWLHSLGANVLGIGLENSEKNSIFNVTNLSEHVEIKILDVTNFDVLVETVEHFKPDYVFHLAAQALVGESYKDPMQTFRTNVLGTINLLEVLKVRAAPCIGVFITSDKSYKNVEQIWGYRETDFLGGDDPYSASKGCADIAINSYTKSFFEKTDIRIAATRAGNVIGGGDFSLDRLVPDCIRHLSQDGEIEIRSPGATRPWQHVLEPLSGYLHLGVSLQQNGANFCSAWNFGPKADNSRTVAEVAEKIVDYWGSGSVCLTGEKKFVESNLLQLDCTKARELMGWEPILSFNEGIEMTVGWYKANHFCRQNNMYKYSIDQIEEYVRRAEKRGACWV